MLRVGGEAREWAEGRCLMFDDSFEHDVIWLGGGGEEAGRQPQDHGTPGEVRTVLLVDVWHPDVDEAGRELVRRHFEWRPVMPATVDAAEPPMLSSGEEAVVRGRPEH